VLQRLDEPDRDLCGTACDLSCPDRLTGGALWEELLEGPSWQGDSETAELAAARRDGRLLDRRGHAAVSTLASLAASGEPGFSAERYLGEAAVTDASELEPLIERILAANPDQVETYRGGKEGVLGFFVGQVMKETQGKADAKVVSELLREKLKA